MALRCPVAYCLGVQSRVRQSSLVLSFYRQLFSAWLAKHLSWHLFSITKQEMCPLWPLSSILSSGSEGIFGGCSWRSGTDDGRKGHIKNTNHTVCSSSSDSVFHACSSERSSPSYCFHLYSNSILPLVLSLALN